ncbi:MAG TPA: hypothetical protein GX499_07810 [Clostridiales bacterium]|nr:hypothetical protein [Clostridiales bacterium]
MKLEQQRNNSAPNSMEYAVAEYLINLCRSNHDLAAAINADDKKTVAGCVAEMTEYARKHKSGNYYAMPPSVAEKIMLEYYGVKPGKASPSIPTPAPKDKTHPIVNILDYLEV